MYLHNDKELFQEVIISTAEDLGLVVPIVEKDYYVTMILKRLQLLIGRMQEVEEIIMHTLFHTIQ